LLGCSNVKQANLAKLNAQIEELTHTSSDPQFWDDSASAQRVMTQLSQLQSKVELVQRCGFRSCAVSFGL
jgi:hypothetical protein